MWESTLQDLTLVLRIHPEAFIDPHHDSSNSMSTPGLAPYLVPFVHPVLHSLIFLFHQQQLCSCHRLGLCTRWALRDRVINKSDEYFPTWKWSQPFGMTPEDKFCLPPLNPGILTKGEGLVLCFLASGPMGPPAWLALHPASISGGWGRD